MDIRQNDFGQRGSNSWRMSDAIKDTKDTPGALKEWVQNRIVVTWLWGSLIVYRVNLLMLFWFILMPFTIAVAIDGYSTRMIRTFRFSFAVAHSSPDRRAHLHGRAIWRGNLAGAADTSAFNGCSTGDCIHRLGDMDVGQQFAEADLTGRCSPLPILQRVVHRRCSSPVRSTRNPRRQYLFLAVESLEA